MSGDAGDWYREEADAVRADWDQLVCSHCGAPLPPDYPRDTYRICTTCNTEPTTTNTEEPNG